MWLNNIIFEDRVIEGERLELSQPDDLYCLGPKLILKNCTLVLRVPTKRLIISGAQLIDCTIDVKKELKGFRWETNFLKGCRFTGRLTGNDFGPYPNSPVKGRFEDCDFSAATLDACRFLECDTSTLRFPPWPCFTILDPARRSRELSALSWPGDIGPIVVEGFAEEPPSTVAVTYSAPALARRRGTTPEAIRATLEKLDGVLY
ncbi:MAG: hypothetical protein JXB05_32115 [Myxococcaceae bacterium]|nr:hypothetical protein [Myxococcaceae bacterium]